jgi:hypothetical protein
MDDESLDGYCGAPPDAAQKVMQQRRNLIKQLRELTSRWTTYEDIPASQQSECKEIGKKLWHMGGMNLMQEAYYEARDANRAASSIQPFWDGIGDWRW